ncbi:unnamed protein product [Paramecium pentaurelia]|uniref:Uncharacterized protein n=1 Tax=Paramecium pentaurelia TaxID=43138 RepID=A0A8S1TIX7_9CILI|nr:unnamed protein product [Paramecium pentaurelia]
MGQINANFVLPHVQRVNIILIIVQRAFLLYINLQYRLSLRLLPLLFFC